MLNIKFRDLYKMQLEEYKNYSFWIDPYSLKIKDFDFSFKISPELSQYIWDNRIRRS